MSSRLRYSSRKIPYYITYGDDKSKKLKGWWVRDPPSGFFTNSDPINLSNRGWIQVFCCILFCWPCSCVPCFLSCNYDGYQFPDYDDEYDIPVAIPINEK
jgi:hypothetical protein